MANYAGSVYLNKIDKMRNWQLVPAPGIVELDRVFADLSSSRIAREVLDDLAAKNQLPGDLNNPIIVKLSLTALMGNKEDMEKLKGLLIEDTLSQMQEMVDDMRNGLAAPKEVANIPFPLIDARAESGKVTKFSALRDIAAKVLEEYRKRHGLDGVIVVHMASREGSPGDIRVIVQQNRVISSLKLNPSIIVRGTANELVYGGGSSRLDDLAPMKLGVPIFTGDFNARGMIDNLQLNLDDPKGSMRAGYKKLIDETSDDLIEDLQEVLMK